MEKLVKLQLDNNIIQKIQRLEKLVNLEWLDLSFNQIEKIEGLSTLSKLQDLSLYDNSITKIEGLDTLCDLKVFSFGKNRVTDLEGTITYLKGLKNNLQVLKMSDNPYIYSGNQNDQDYKLQAVFRLKNLKYLDYELIDEPTRDAAQKKCGDQFNDNEQTGEKKDDDDSIVDPELVDAKINCTENMLERFLEGDEENGQKLKFVPNFDALWQGMEVDVSEKTEGYQKSIKDIHRVKMNTITFCLQELQKEETLSEKKSVALISKFQSYKKHKMRELDDVDEKDNKMQILKKYEDELLGKVDELEDKLMEYEMSL